jgi:hypothetical protein
MALRVDVSVAAADAAPSEEVFSQDVAAGAARRHPARRGDDRTSPERVSVNGSSAHTDSSQYCAGSQTVTAHDGDNLTRLVENHVSGSYETQRVVDIVVDMNGIANRDLIYANQQYRLPITCSNY